MESHVGVVQSYSVCPVMQELSMSTRKGDEKTDTVLDFAPSVVVPVAVSVAPGITSLSPIVPPASSVVPHVSSLAVSGVQTTGPVRPSTGGLSVHVSVSTSRVLRAMHSARRVSASLGMR